MYIREAEMLCPTCKPKPISIKTYKFAACPKCARRRPINPTSGLCWDCGKHYADPKLARVAPEIKAELKAVDRRISEGLAGGIHTDDLRKLIALRESLSESI